MGWFDFSGEPKDDLYAADRYAEMIRLQRESMESGNKISDELSGIATAPSNPEYDDWEPKHDHWRKVTVCGCGFRLEPGDRMPYADVCPDCGNTDHWESFIARLEWEQSHKKYVMLLLGRDMYSYAFSETYAEFVHAWAEECSKRNIKLVRHGGGQ